MKKVLVWLKNRFFIIMLVVFGILFLSFTDNWQVYAKPLAQAGDWCGQQLERLGLKEVVMLAEGDETENGDEQGLVSDGEVATGSESEKLLSADGTVSSGNASGSLNGTENGLLIGSDKVVYTSVEDDYFADALFIGDSRTVGMYEYGGLEEIATFYASTGLTVYKMFDAEIVEVPGQKKKQTVEEALQENSFGKIYLMIGINEMGTGTVESFIEKYKEVVEHLRELQPEATIYIQGIMKVTTERSEQGDYINNEGIEARNTEIAKLADNVTIFYLDVNPYICDETGGIEPSYTYDGVHLKAQYISIWKDYLKAHAVVTSS